MGLVAAVVLEAREEGTHVNGASIIIHYLITATSAAARMRGRCGELAADARTN